jgi:hypothetical protein
MQCLAPARAVFLLMMCQPTVLSCSPHTDTCRWLNQLNPDVKKGPFTPVCWSRLPLLKSVWERLLLQPPLLTIITADLTAAQKGREGTAGDVQHRD